MSPLALHPWVLLKAGLSALQSPEIHLWATFMEDVLPACHSQDLYQSHGNSNDTAVTGAHLNAQVPCLTLLTTHKYNYIPASKS